MDHSSGICEIVEAKDDVSSIQHSQVYPQDRRPQKEWQPSLSKIDSNKYLKDDINKLFEAIDISTSKSLDLADRSRKNASKRPMRVGPSSSPGFGFSEPVSLKQALRGLCISQAGEMAAMRRLPRSPASPGYLDARRSTPVYRSVETAESPRMGREDLIEISVSSEGLPPSSLGRKQGYPNMQLPYRNSQSSSHFAVTKSTESSRAPSFVSSVLSKPRIQPVDTKKVEGKSLEPIMKSGQGALSPPSLSVEPTSNGQFSTQRSDGNFPASEKIEIHPFVPVSTKEKGTTLSSTFPFHNAVDNTLKLHESMSSSRKVASSSSRKVGASMKVAKKAAPRIRRKKKLHIVSSSLAMRSSRPTQMKTTSHEVKPATRSKNLVVKNLKQERIMIGIDSYTSSEAVSSSDFSSGPLICHKCQCSLTNAKKEANEDVGTPIHHSESSSVVDVNEKYAERSPPGSIPKSSNTSAVPSLQANRTPKFREKAEFSPSSMSSIGEYSASSSISDESNASGSSCGNRPHMSKDFRWEALDNARKQHGFLSLRHFNLLKKLGSGDIGTVYLAELVGVNCLFAIKVMDNEFLARRKKMPRAQTEREILRMLDHPFLPTLYAQFTSDDLSCLVMEFCPGGDLHVLRQKQPGRYFPEQAARFYVAEILLALEYLHLLGIVYRDLKPENILVREDGHIMLTDFDLSLRCSVSPTLVKSSSSVIEPPRISGPCAGSNCIDPFCSGPSCKVSCFNPRVLPATARSRRRLAEQAAQSASLPQLVAEPTEARSNSFVGTHEYLAPEIIKGEGHGSAVDWWTLGILLYELLYGKTPFKGPGNDETLTNVVVQSLKFPDSPIVSFQARDLIRGLLVKEPENRLGTETGAAEIKRHSFFDGMNWALIRCAIPPQIPESLDIGIQRSVLQQKDRYVEGDQLEFELF